MSNQSTYQTRIVSTPEIDAFLDTYVNHYNYVERELYADMQKAKEPAAIFKNRYLVEYGLTARQFNAIGRNLEGKIDSVLEVLSLRKQETAIKIDKINKVIKKLNKKITAAKKNGSDCSKAKFSSHQKKRRLHILETRLAAIEQQQADQDPRICFGSRELFRKQFNLEINGYHDHADWLKDWQSQRNSQFYVLGSGDEESGCQGCQITENIDGTFGIRLRSPSKVAEYLTIDKVAFKYGSNVINNTIAINVAAKVTRSDRDKLVRINKKASEAAEILNIEPVFIDVPPAILGQALSYRFLRDAKGWRIMVTTDQPDFQRISVEGDGYVGLDINADCITLAETNRHGNLLNSKVIPLVTYGKNTDQAETLICEVAKQIVDYAALVKKPVCMERLSFKAKKAALNKDNPKQARMLSSLSYNKIIQAVKARAYRFGIVVKDVNPAYTSVIGLVNYSKKFGISVHQAAAFAVARRGSDCRERLKTGKDVVVPTPKGDHIAFALPVRNRAKHKWAFFLAVKTIHTKALAAHFRPPDDGDPLKLTKKPSMRKCPEFTVKPRNLSQQYCLAGAMDQIPW